MIRVVDLYKSFGKQQVLRGVNLDFAKGKTTTIVGTSGCGKTVLLKHLNALLLPDRGEVLIDGIDITKLGQKELYQIRAKFGVLFQGCGEGADLQNQVLPSFQDSATAGECPRYTREKCLLDKLRVHSQRLMEFQTKRHHATGRDNLRSVPTRDIQRCADLGTRA